jgi:PAS domain S-box-containing protein
MLSDCLPEEREAERELKRLNRSLHLLSASRLALFRSESEQQLLDEVCQLSVGIGGYRMCWVGYAMEDAGKSVLPVADCGLAADYLSQVRISWSDGEHGQGITGQAIRSGQPAVNRSFTSNSAMAPWRETALRHGLQSSIALPLCEDGLTFGTLNVYATEADAFHEQEVALLQELADTLVFGIRSIRARTEQRKAEEQLVLLSTAINEVRDAVFLVDSEGRFRYVNEQAARSLGYCRHELIGMSVPDIDDDWPVERIRQTFASEPASGRETVETWHRRKNGSRFPVEISINHFVYQGESYKLALARDITERHQLEAARHESDSRYRQILELSSDGLYLMEVTEDERFRYIEVNPSFERMCAVKREQMVGHFAPAAVVDDVSRQRVLAKYRSCLHAGRQIEQEVELTTPAGTAIFHSTLIPVRDDSGRIYRIVGVSRDITAQKRLEAERQAAEAARRESDQRFERAFENAAIGKALLSPDGRWLRANRVLCEMLGYSEAELQQTNYQTLTHPEDLERGSEETRRVVAGELPRMQIEKRYRHSDGRYIWTRLTCIMVRGDQDEPLYFISQIENIDEHRRLQQRLNQADFALSRVREGIFVTDDAGQVRYVNEEACRALGYPREELLAMALKGIDPGFRDGGERKRLLAAREMVREHGTFLFESRHRHKDGRVFPVEILANAFEHEGEFLCLSLVRDISERKRLEAEREQSERRYREIFDNTLDSLFLLEVTPELCFRTLAVNPAFERTVGIPREAMVGRLIEETVPADVAAATNAKYRRCVAAGTTIDEEVELELPVGRRHFHSTLVPVRDDSGRIHRIVGITRDITERKQAEAIMHAREQEFRAFVENSPDSIVRYDTECRRVYLNPVAISCTRMPLEEMLGRSPVETPHGNLAAARKLQAYLQQVIASGEPLSGSIDWRSADGRGAYYDLRVVPEFDRSGKLASVLSIGRDIRALKEAEQRLQESHDVLRELAARRETAREEERKHIAREIHDELGQILTALRMDVSMLRLKYAKTMPALLDDVQALVCTVDKTIQVVRDVVAELRPMVLDMGVAPAIEWLVAEFERHGRTACRLRVCDSAAVLDEQRATVVFRIVQESLTNIARHAEATQVDISLESDGSHYWLKVRDNGKGFQPARVRKASFGLISMRERALMLGGAVHIASQPGLGTEICVRIPVQNPVAERP